MSSFHRYMRLRTPSFPPPKEYDKHDPQQFLEWCYSVCMKEQNVFHAQNIYGHSFSLKQIQEQFEAWDLDETK
jgi:hypothetical protein